MILLRPPKTLYYGEEKPKRQIKAFRISERTANTIKYALILGVLLTTLYAFMSFKQANIMGFFGSQAFIYVALSFVFIYICWQAITNKLAKFPVEIVRVKTINYKPKKNRSEPSFIKQASLFSIVGYTLSLAFTFMVMIFLLVAHLSGTGETRVVWDHFGEMTFETVLFVCAFVVILIGYYFSLKNFKKITREG